MKNKERLFWVALNFKQVPANRTLIMNSINKEYFDRKNQTLQNRYPIPPDKEPEWRFNFVSAELLNFLSEIPFVRHRSVFENILVNARLNKAEQDYSSVLNNISLVNFSKETENYIQNNPCIFCAWHFGSYRLINHFIAQKNIPYCLVISKQIVQSEGNDFLQRFSEKYPRNRDLQIVDAESPNAGICILRLIKQGYSILFYIDGNTGTGLTRDNSNNCYIDFLAGKIFARTGVAFLSHLSKTPILPIISYRKSIDQNVFHFHQLIFPEKQKARIEYAQDCTQKLYNLLSIYVETNTDQWEAWLYLYKVMKSGDSKSEEAKVKLPIDHSTKQFIFNHRLFGVYRWENGFYLFNKKDFIAYPINRDIYGFFKGVSEGKLNTGRLDKDLFSQLYRKQVLIYAD